MAKVEKIADNQYKYNCICGKSVILETTEKVNRLVKCFNCLTPFSENNIDLLTEKDLW